MLPLRKIIPWSGISGGVILGGPCRHRSVLLSPREQWKRMLINNFPTLDERLPQIPGDFGMFIMRDDLAVAQFCDGHWQTSYPDLYKNVAAVKAWQLLRIQEVLTRHGFMTYETPGILTNKWAVYPLEKPYLTSHNYVRIIDGAIAILRGAVPEDSPNHYVMHEKSVGYPLKSSFYRDKEGKLVIYEILLNGEHRDINPVFEFLTQNQRETA